MRTETRIFGARGLKFQKHWRTEFGHYYICKDSKWILNKFLKIKFKIEIVSIQKNLKKNCLRKNRDLQIDIEYFPYDKQNCTMKFGGWSYNGFLLDVRQLPASFFF